MSEKIENKKRIMYMSGEDFYFFTYNILIILKELGCTDGRVFRDYRKLPYVVDVISDQHLLNILKRNNFGRIKSPVDKKHLISSYTSCKIKTSEYLKLLFSLEKKGIVSLSSSKRSSQIDVSLNKGSIAKDFFKSEVFDNERQNISILNSEVQRISSINFETLIDKLYTAETDHKWAV